MNMPMKNLENDDCFSNFTHNKQYFNPYLTQPCDTGKMSPYAITTSGLLAQGARISAIARNIANVNTVNTVPVDVVSISSENGGVTTRETTKPDAPLENQLVNLISAENGYKANAKAIKVQKEMDDALLDILT